MKPLSRQYGLVCQLLCNFFLIHHANTLSELSKVSLEAISAPGDDFDIKNGKLLSPILQPRVPGTEGSTNVLNHFADFFAQNLPLWDLSYHNFSSQVPPDGRTVPFVNMIAKRDPPGARPGQVSYLTLVAHYDSMNEKGKEGFIGATDSAVPCAILMHVARTLEPALSKKWASRDTAQGDHGLDDDDADQGFQILFLDGEEAFVHWSDEDSIYGARALAEHMDSTFHPALSTYRNELDSISLFVLLDLLGTAHPTVPSYYPTTHWAYQRMAKLAQRMDKSKAQSTKMADWFPQAGEKNDNWLGGQIGDDHTPFQARGVEILHVIPLPFPAGIWHEMADDGEHLDLPTCQDWAVLTTAFAAEWLDLDKYMPQSRAKRGAILSDDIISKTEL